MSTPIAAEGTDELREALVDAMPVYVLHRFRGPSESPSREYRERTADALLAGPLAPLLAKVQTVELAWEDGYEACRTGVQRYRNPHRRALGGGSRG